MDSILSKYAQATSNMKMLQQPTIAVDIYSSTIKNKKTIHINSITSSTINDLNTDCSEQEIKDLCLTIDVGLCNWPDPKTINKYPIIYFDGVHFNEIDITNDYLVLLYKNIRIELIFTKRSWFVKNYRKVFVNCTIDCIRVRNIITDFRYELVKSFIKFFCPERIILPDSDFKQFHKQIKPQKNEQPIREVCILYQTSKIDKYINELKNTQIILLFDKNTLEFPKKICIPIHTLRLVDVTYSDVELILKNIEFRVENIEIFFRCDQQKTVLYEFKELVDTFKSYNFKFTTNFSKKCVKKFMKVFDSYVDHKRVIIENN